MKLVAAVFAASSLVASAGSITTIGQDLTGPVNVIGITEFQTTGAEMDGMKITGAFSDGNSVSCFWGDTGANSGSCSASNGTIGFLLTLSGDSYTNAFALSAITGFRLLSLTFEGLPGNTVFDRTFGGVQGTPNSSFGQDALGSTVDGANITIDGEATYYNPVGVAGNAAVNDLFAKVVIQFLSKTAGVPNGLAPGNTANFEIDTDTVGQSGVPEPGTFGLLGSALVGLGFASWRQRRHP